MATLDDNGVDEPLDASSPPIPADGGGEAAPPLPSPLEDDEVDIDIPLPPPEPEVDDGRRGSVVDGEYKVDLDVFEGPLDLLLYLIRKDEIDIYDIKIERITKQYMAYLDLMKQLDLNIAGEFIVMAATLMLIKSRTLLPVETRKGADDEEEEEADPRLDLVRQLVEYKKFKDAATSLMWREALQAERFLAGGEASIGDADALEPNLGDIGLFDLLTAFQEVLQRAPVSPLGHLKPITWSVPDKMELILDQVGREKRVAFSKLFTAESPRGEVIVSFLALLELLKQHRVSVRQLAPFTEILVCEFNPLAVPVADAADGEQDHG